MKSSAAIALLLAGHLAAQSKPFSHKLHIKLGLNCLACHSTVAASTAINPTHLVDQTTCKKCHPQSMPVKRQGPPIAVKFSHRQHLKLGNAAPVIAAAISAKTYHFSTTGSPPPANLRAQLNTQNACGACHRGVEDNEAVTTAVLPKMQDCLVCHPRIDPPFSCELCHQPGPHLKPADHTRTFAEMHSTGKANLNKPACPICHGRRFTCMGCH